MNDDHSSNKKETPAKRPSLANIILSTLAAFIGVQSDKNRVKDFSQNSFIPFLVAGVIIIALFYLVLVYIARIISP